jgi:hypothetical protein
VKLTSIPFVQRRHAKVLVDVLVLVGFVVEFVSREKSFDAKFVLHSYAGFVLAPLLALHLWGNAGWVRRVWRNKRHDREARLASVNLLFGTTTVICIVSGLPLWFDWNLSGVLRALHAAMGFVSILLVAVHLGMNRRRFARLVRGSRSGVDR